MIFNIATTNLTNAVTCTGEAYEEIAKLVDDQPRNDWEHLGDTMHDYRGMLSGWPGIIQVHSVSCHKMFLLLCPVKIRALELIFIQ